MRFHDPWLLLLLLLLPLWLWWERRAMQRGGLKYSSVAAARNAGSFWTMIGPALLTALRGATLVLFVGGLGAAAVGPQRKQNQNRGH